MQNLATFVSRRDKPPATSRHNELRISSRKVGQLGSYFSNLDVGVRHGGCCTCSSREKCSSAREEENVRKENVRKKIKDTFRRNFEDTSSLPRSQLRYVRRGDKILQEEIPNVAFSFARSRFFCQSLISPSQSIFRSYVKFLGLLRSILYDERAGKRQRKESSGNTRFPVSLLAVSHARNRKEFQFPAIALSSASQSQTS